MQISFFERLKSVRNDLKLSLHSPMVSLKKKSESLIKYYIKVTCAFKWARKLPRKTETYESAKCVPCNTRKCTHNGFVSDLLKWALKCRFYATGPRLSRDYQETVHGAWRPGVSDPVTSLSVDLRTSTFTYSHQLHIPFDLMFQGTSKAQGVSRSCRWFSNVRSKFKSEWPPKRKCKLNKLRQFPLSVFKSRLLSSKRCQFQT